MPSLKSPKIQQIIRCLDARRHTVEINVGKWQTLLKEFQLNHPIRKSAGSYSISRASLFRMPNARADKKCLEIVMWGYPSGGRGNNIRNALRNLPEVSASAATPKSSWRAYYLSFDRGWGVNTSTITKFAYFFGHKFGGNNAVILDRQVAVTLNSAHWSSALRTVGNYPWRSAYPSYLAQINRLAESLRVKPDQIELFLYLIGSHLR